VRFVRHRRNTGESYKVLKRPLTIAGMVLGTLALLVIIFTSYHIDIGFITGFATAFIVLAALIFILFGLNLRRNVVLP